MLDYLGKELKVGQKVVRAVKRGSSSAQLETRTVVKIENGKVYLNSAKLVALDYPERILIIEDT